MITIKKGDIFATECQTIVNTINCVGVMGAGIAFECRLHYQEMYSRYVELCNEKKISIGTLWIYKSDDKWILNFPTKNHWKYESKIEYLEKGLQKFLDTYKEKGIKSIAFPLLGASKGGIPEEKSIEVMKKYLERCDNIDIEIYHFDPDAYDKSYLEFKKIWTRIPEKELKKELKNLKEKELKNLRERLDDLKKENSLNNSREIEKINEKINEKIKEKPLPISTISKALGDENIRRLSGLLSVRGLGVKTVEKAVHFIKNYQGNNQYELFNDD